MKKNLRRVEQFLQDPFSRKKFHQDRVRPLLGTNWYRVERTNRKSSGILFSDTFALNFPGPIHLPGPWS